MQKVGQIFDYPDTNAVVTSVFYNMIYNKILETLNTTSATLFGYDMRSQNKSWATILGAEYRVCALIGWCSKHVL